ncbi:hypothetical protein VCHA50O409_20470 [Vibrio chagasii]|nr:hypothetical protein VCHA50O409_20470 [Vibrio chagasii]CAH7180391.1 hypothetical protein VCHA50O404_20309 [Vibrio chagasii]CAH7341665.1 hypothetical protein VCHA50O384_20393 [Vibrio chagasii]
MNLHCKLLLTFLPSYLLTFKPQSPFSISLSPFLVELRQVATLAKRKTPNYNVQRIMLFIGKGEANHKMGKS